MINVVPSSTEETTDRPAVRFVASVFGKKGHLLAWSVGPDDESDAAVIMAQWCFPSRRQHAGRFAFVLEANSAGLISGKLNRTISRKADARRIAVSVLPRKEVCKLRVNSVVS